MSLGAASAQSDEYEYYPSREGRRFSVTGVLASRVSPPTELRHMWRDRDALCVTGHGTEATDALDDNLQRILERVVSGVVQQSDAEGYAYDEQEVNILRISARGCGHLYGDDDVLRWTVALSPSVQVWDRSTGRRLRRNETMGSMTNRRVPVRLIVALRGVAVPYEDGPYFDFEVVAIEVEKTAPGPTAEEERSVASVSATPTPTKEKTMTEVETEVETAAEPAIAEHSGAVESEITTETEPPTPSLATDEGEGGGGQDNVSDASPTSADSTLPTEGGGEDNTIEELIRTQRLLADRIASLTKNKLSA